MQNLAVSHMSYYFLARNNVLKNLPFISMTPIKATKYSFTE